MPIYTPPPGAAVALPFRQRLDTAHPVALAFGDDAGAVGGDAVGVLAAVLPALRAEILGGGSAGVVLANLPGLSVAVVGSYDNAVPRGLRLFARGGWVQGAPVPAAVRVPWVQSARALVQASAPWREAAPVVAAVRAAWLPSARAVVGVGLGWEQGHAQRVALASGWQIRERARVDGAAAWSVADRQRVQLFAPWGRMPRLRAGLSAAWAVAVPQRRQWVAPHGLGRRLVRGVSLPWAQAVRAPAGVVTVQPPIPPVVRCYTPPLGGAVDLIFADRWFGASTVLRFRCRDFDLPAAYTVPLRKAYVAVHTLSALRLPDLQPVTLQSCTISADADGFGWSLTATGPGSLMAQLAPTANGPVQIRVEIDGAVWGFVVESLGRTRVFGEQRVQIQGRSLPALLGAPYSAVQSWSNAGGAQTAAQLIDAALLNTGITADTSLIDDWLVPAGAWSHSGPALSAVLRVAESIGAVVVSERADPVLKLLPRYPVMPWEWMGAAVAPDVRLPLASVVRDSYERRDAPDYNRAIVSGESQGVLGIITRTGSGGTLPAPMVTDALATAQAAVLQRGRSILGAAGNQALITLELPVLSGPTLPGVLDVGQLVEVIEPDETWRGLARSVSVRATNYPTVRQSVTLERHYYSA